jgi:hypothetical protein
VARAKVSADVASLEASVEPKGSAWAWTLFAITLSGARLRRSSGRSTFATSASAMAGAVAAARRVGFKVASGNDRVATFSRIGWRTWTEPSLREVRERIAEAKALAARYGEERKRRELLERVLAREIPPAKPEPVAEAPAAPAAVQRWTERRESYRPAGEPIDPKRYGVEIIEERAARPFVERHHYSASFPAARLSVGLFRAGEGLVGTAVFAVPTSNAIAQRRVGVDAAAAVVLGRFVLRDDVEANGETWFLARAFRALRRELQDVRAVVSYSDPFARSTAAGAVVMPGHVGTIYQAFNAAYLGRTRPERLILCADGRSLAARTLSKLRNDERGAAGAYRQLLQAGAPRRVLGESGPVYVERALACGAFRALRHPGQHVYGWALDPAIALARAGPYPKRAA